MSTRSIVHIHDEQCPDQIVCSFYAHYDGQPESPHGIGNHIKEWLKNEKITYGETNRENKFNGMGKLAIFLPKALNEKHSTSMIETGGYGMDEEYTYHLYNIDDSFKLTVNGEEW